jgi:hypothetical protein
VNDPSKHQHSLKKLMVYATAISFGGLGAFLCSLRHVRDDPTLVLSYWTILGFIIGAVTGFAFWAGVDHLEKKNRGPR